MDTSRPAGGPPSEPPRAEPLRTDPTAAFDETSLIETPASAPQPPWSPTVEPVAAEPPSLALKRNPPDGRRRVGRAPVAIVLALGLLAIGGTAVLGNGLSQDLAASRAQLAATTGEVATASASLVDTTAKLDETTKELADAGTKRTQADTIVAGLEKQVATQTECVRLQAAALDELVRISDLLTDNFNRTAEDSAYAKANESREKALGSAIDNYYLAYKNAFLGSTSAARGYAAKGKTAEGTVTAQEKVQAKELAAVNAGAKVIEAAIDALEVQLDAMAATCGEVAP